MSDTEKVFIVDDDEAVRDAIGMLLETVDIPYVTYPDALSFLEQADLNNVNCLVLDIRMPGMSGLELQEKLAAMKVELPIVFITGHGDIPMAVEAMRRGAVDFLRKPFRDQELLDRIQEALSRDAQHRDQAADSHQLKSRIADLTPRELEVFQRVAKGQANKVIAIELGISERTVEIHRSNVMQKTSSRSLADLVRLLIKLEELGPAD
ncbi:MAG: response regulator transcription factor [Pseudomonadaceae bacterium]|nr:response regulator transcription factor [Pseudomonadaceae bacterium]